MKGKTVSPQQSALQNRLRKNLKKLKSYLQKEGITCYRLYQKDIPEYPYLIDIYDQEAVIYEQGKKLKDDEVTIRFEHQQDIETAISEVLSIPKERQHFKTRERQKGKEQYRPLDPRSNEFFVVTEPPFRFLVNLERYLDTGLFLDHRPLRRFLSQNVLGTKALNLFCYTGSISVALGLGGAKVTSIDMSRTYLEWAQENFRINELDPKDHTFIQEDVLKELDNLKEKGAKFDIIVLDPPSFSNSKRMEEDLDVDRDHPLLIRNCMHLLKPEGTLYFSTNKRRFELHSIVTQHYSVKEISHWTIPQDFHGSQIHRSFAITFKK